MVEGHHLFFSGRRSVFEDNVKQGHSSSLERNRLRLLPAARMFCGPSNIAQTRASRLTVYTPWGYTKISKAATPCLEKRRINTRKPTAPCLAKPVHARIFCSACAGSKARCGVSK